MNCIAGITSSLQLKKMAAMDQAITPEVSLGPLLYRFPFNGKGYIRRRVRLSVFLRRRVCVSLFALTVIFNVSVKDSPLPMMGSADSKGAGGQSGVSGICRGPPPMHDLSCFVNVCRWKAADSVRT